MTGAQRVFQIHAAAWGAVNGFIFLIWLVIAVSFGVWFPWFVFPLGGWGIALAVHATAVYTRQPGSDDEIEPADERPQLGY